MSLPLQRNFQRSVLLFLLSILSFNVSAQLDKVHYIPPFFAPDSVGTKYKDVGEQWIVLSTQEDDAFDVSIYRGVNLFGTYSVSKSSPNLISLGTGFDTPTNPTGIVNETGMNRVLADQGFKLEAEKSFFAAIYQRSNAQGDVLTCKGETALGSEFYSGHIFGFLANNSRKANFLTVMATFDNTEVTFSNPRVKWQGQGSNTFTVTLNKNESYALGASYSYIDQQGYDVNDFNGTKVTSTKPIAVNSGSWNGSGNTGGSQDIGIDQLVPQNFVGQKYIVVQGYGTQVGEKVIVVATKPNTQLFVNDTLEHTFVQSGDYYVVSRDEYSSVSSNMFIESDENVYVYQTLSGRSSDVSVGLCFIPPLSCLSNREVNISYANQIGDPMLNLITELGSEVTINGKKLIMAAQPVVGNPDWVTYRLDNDAVSDFSASQASFEIVSTSAINAALAFEDGSIGGAGFYSGFGVSPQLQAAPTVVGTEACYPSNATMHADGYDSYIWYYNNEIIVGETGPVFEPQTTGQYRVSGTTTCGTTKASDPFILKTCLSMEGGGSFMEDVGDVVVNLRLGLPSDVDVEYWYRTFPLSGSGATEGVDYEAKTGIGVIPAGSIEDSLFITILDDDIDESNEQFRFELYFTDNATIQNDILTFRIIDNEGPPTVNVMGNVTINEGEGMASLSIAKVGETDQVVSVSYSTRDQSAIAGQHYEETIGTLVFQPEENLKAVNVPLIDNTELNDRRIFYFTLDSAINADIGTGGAKVLIYDDDDASVSLSMMPNMNDEVEEGEPIYLNIQLAEAVALDVTFDLSVEYFTADSNDIVFDSPLSCVIKAGLISFDYACQTVEDNRFESDEIVSFSISNIVNATPGQTNSSHVILNDDFVPELLADNFSCQEDDMISASVIDNDINMGDTPVVITFLPPAIGVFSDLGRGEFSYFPPLNYSGAINFSYQVKDATGDSAQASVQILVQQENDVPIAIDDTIVTDEEVPVSIYVLDNDLDIDNTGLNIETVYDNKLGDVEVNRGYILYSPKLNANGSEVLRYEITDTEGDPSIARIYVTVRPVNDVPIANDDSYRVDEDAPVTTFDVLQNDDDQDRSGLTITRLYNAVGGEAILQNNKVEFALYPNFWGDAGFDYTIEDGEGDSAVATTVIEVLGANDFPVALTDFATTNEDERIIVPLLANDTDDDQRGLTVTRVDDAIHGVVTSDLGIWTYEPHADFCGRDSFRYFIEDWNRDADYAWVMVQVNCVNEAPRAVADTFVLTEDDPMVVLDVSANDEDPDGSGIVIKEILNLSGGQATVVLQKVDYTLTPDFFGDAGFDYVLQDGENDLDTVHVYVKVLPSNDKPLAVNDTMVMNEDDSLAINLLSNDEDIDRSGLLLDTITAPEHGTVTTIAGLTTYTPEANYCGEDSFSYIIVDAQGDMAIASVLVVVNCVNESPTALVDSVFATEDVSTVFYPLVNDEDPDAGGLSILSISNPKNGVLSQLGGDYHYTSNTNYNGLDSLSYTISDGEGDQSDGWVIFTVIAVNDYPVASDDAVMTDEDSILLINPLANDSDVEDIVPTSLSIHQEPKMGVYELNGNVITYTPDENQWGRDTITYVAKDSYGAASDVATISILVNSVNENPIVINLSSSLDEDKRDTTEVLAYASDPDFSGLSISSARGAKNGTSEVLGSQVIYSPNPDYYGADTLTYDVVDGEGDTSRGFIFYNIVSINDAPTAVDDYIGTGEDMPIAFYPTESDADIEDIVPRDITILQQPSRGDFVIEDLLVTYTPWPNLWGGDTMTYTVKDKEGELSNVATIFITVDSINEAPLAADVHINVDEDNRDTVDVMLFASSPDFSDLTLLTPHIQGGNLDYYAKNGEVSAWNNQLLYIPYADFYGQDSLLFMIQDGEGDKASALLTIEVLSVNDAPVAVNDFYTNTIGGIKDSAEITLTVTDNDSDVDEVPLQGRVTVDSLPLNGSVAFTEDGLGIIYTPDSSFMGYDSLCYRVQDTLSAASNQAWVTIFSDSFNYVPRAVNDSLVLMEDASITFNPMANDWDIHNDSIWPTVNNLTPTTGPFDVLSTPHGYVELQSDTVWRYYPQADYYGKDSSYYQANDAKGGVKTAKLLFDIKPVNDVPVAAVQTAQILYLENTGWKNLFYRLGLSDIDSDTLYRVELSVFADDMTPSSVAVEDTPWLTLEKDSSLSHFRMVMTGDNTSISEWESLLQVTKYRNISDFDTLTHNVEMVVWDTQWSHSDTLHTRIIMNPINDAPENVLIPHVSGIFLKDSTLHCDTGTWIDPDGEIDYCFLWYYRIDGEVKTIENACSNVLVVPEGAESADYLWCEVRATDDGYPLPQKSTVVSSDTIVPSNYRPVGAHIDGAIVYRTMIQGDVIGTLSASDRDTLQGHAYTLNDNLEWFYIVGDTIKLDTAGYYIEDEIISISIKVTDDGTVPLSYDVPLTITVINDLMPLMKEGYPQLKDVFGDSVAIMVQSDKPGKALYDVFSLEDYRDGGSSVLRFKQDLLPNVDVLLEADSLVSEVDYMALVSFVDTSGHHYSEAYQFPFRTLDVNGPQFLSSTPRVISAGVDSAIIAVRLDEGGDLYYSVCESDTMYYADSVSIDTLDVGMDSMLMPDVNTTYYFKLDSLKSQMRYDIAFHAADTSRNMSSVSHFQFSTNDTISPQFEEGYPMLEEVSGSKISYKVCFTEGGVVHARLRNNYQGLTDFSSSDGLGIYNDMIQVSEDSIMDIQTEKLLLDGVYLLDMMLEDSAGNRSQVKTVSFRYPEPFEMIINSEVIFIDEDLSFKVLNDEAQYRIYDLNGALLREGVVSQPEDVISFNFVDEGVFLIQFSTPRETKFHKIMKVNCLRP